ncbi:hypothetical protein P3T21_007178 [Paraburkholderia sp. GAS334]
MANATLIGIDLGKHCFFVHARRRSMQTSWARSLQATYVSTVWLPS